MKKIILKKNGSTPTLRTSSKPEIQSVPSNHNKKLDALQKARDARMKMRESGEASTTRRSPREIWEADKTSLRKAVNAGCYDCCGGENYINRIRYCNLFDKCSFWYVRPYSKGITKEMCENWKEFEHPSKSDSEELDEIDDVVIEDDEIEDEDLGDDNAV
jgi:hypothetical protein